MSNLNSRITYEYITGLKGIACFLIMIGHYLSIYFFSSDFNKIFLLDFIINNKLLYLFFLNVEYWLYLFFVLSGYLCSKGEIVNFKVLFIKIIRRTLRFALPVFFSYIVIFIMYKFIGFHTVDTSYLFECSWYQNYFTESYSYIDVLFAPYYVLFKGICVLNSTYWVIKLMFLGSILIYILKFFLNMVNINPSYKLYFLILLNTLMLYVSPIVSSMIMGFVLSYYEDQKINKTCKNICFLYSIFMIYLVTPQIIASFFFCILIILVPKISSLKSFLSSKIFTFLGNISWGIYSFHWPLMGSIGGLLIVLLTNLCYSLKLSYLIAIFICVLTTVLISIIYEKTFGSLVNWFLQIINK